MSETRILMGVVGRPHGVRGLVRVHTYTADPASLAGYTLSDDRGRPWQIVWRGDGVAELIGGNGRRVADRNEAETLVNLRLYTARDALPPADDEEFYAADLEGCDAFDRAGKKLGRVAAVHDYGAGTFLEIAGEAEHLVPFTKSAVPEVDLPARRLVVDPPEPVEVGAPGT